MISRSLPQTDGTQGWLFGPWQLRSAFQPIFTLKSGKAEIAGYEGLIRPFLAERPVNPALFFRSIEKRDRMQVETLTRDLHLSNLKCLPAKDALMFVNIDPSAICSVLDISQTLASIRKSWTKTKKPANRLVCEIIEKNVKSPALLFSLTDAIKANGFGLAIDDYGAEHSDAKRLAHLRPNIVKFDRRWVTRMLNTPSGYGQIKVFTAKMHGNGIATVFEGIETLKQLELSELCGATYIQGFALAKPEIAPTSFQRFVKSSAPRTSSEALAALRHIAIDAATGFRPLYTHQVA